MLTWLCRQPVFGHACLRLPLSLGMRPLDLGRIMLPQSAVVMLMPFAYPLMARKMGMKGVCRRHAQKGLKKAPNREGMPLVHGLLPARQTCLKLVSNLSQTCTNRVSCL